MSSDSSSPSSPAPSSLSSTTDTHPHARKWWKEATVYQIYPASFQDSNNDGIGDIPGIISRLHYLRHTLGVDCVWLSPHYASPQVDMGYDISDYEDVYAPYGTLDQTQNLIDACHALGMRIIFDLVINHTSDQHRWFQESRSSRDNPKRDWYIWRPAKGWTTDGKPIPPNNWRAAFGGSTWTWDDRTHEFYLHLFAPQQPDLNWESVEARQAMYESSMHFWLRRGVDGFRVDVVNQYSKGVTFPDAPVVDMDQIYQPCGNLTSNGPRMHEFLSEMYAVCAQYEAYGGGEIMTVGELHHTPLEADVRAYVSAAAQQMSMVFNFDAVNVGQSGDRSTLPPLRIDELKKKLAIWQNFVSQSDAWVTCFLENHDLGRSISRFGDDSTEQLRTRSGKLLATVLATMTGTLFLYQGQEIGTINIPRNWPIEEYKDVLTVNVYNGLRDSGASRTRLEEAHDALQKLARDHARTPLQWSNESPNAGFCEPSVTPWMRVNDSCASINVTREIETKDSVLNFWRALIQTRVKYRDAWVYGEFQLLETEDNLFAFDKVDDVGNKFTVVTNMGSQAITVASSLWGKRALLLLSNTTDGDRSGSAEETLQPWEARIYAS